ncbi:Ubiquitin and WLM domain-containing metalloprotease [Cocos nucifera]|uniref:Ubiquitin and WLM domain-containing metalloprotease n=1 Tax=Cocos nucifera TaxID=13894 RepID=A0A8K0IPP4_COCNU|nr:Ubiquitin and WLM domain-containing metalloprotease [Cocos nucifera]
MHPIPVPSLLIEGKSIRMMGVFDDEIEEVSQNGKKPDLRILGFDEEEKRLRQRMLNRPQVSLKLPQGSYIFCDFRTLSIPGIELNPSPSEALRRMHMLACDPGIIAVMNKHHWRVGIMTEMAPVGYVGISPKCILGFNKNHGEEISLRLRTDDLKGFRKYKSIKETLLHELAHMVYSEHDANFFALNKQLNEEATSLDWTKSRSHTLSGHKITDHYEDELYLGVSSNDEGQKLGGTFNSLVSARASSVAAAYGRFLNATSSAGLVGHQETAQHSLNDDHKTLTTIEPDPDDGELKGDLENKHVEPDPDDAQAMDNDVMHVDFIMDSSELSSEFSMLDEHGEPDPDDRLDNGRMFEPDPDDSHAEDSVVPSDEPDPDDSVVGEVMKSFEEPGSDHIRSNRISENCQNMSEPDPDDPIATGTIKDAKQMEDTYVREKFVEPDPDEHTKEMVLITGSIMEPCAQGMQAAESLKAEPDPDDHMSGLDNQELQRIEDPVAAICSRLQRATEMLRSEVTPAEATSALKTLFKIIRNVIEHPNDVKFRRLRKANPQFQRNVANYKAALEVLALVGFCEDVISDELGRAETYMVLKRNDPGLLWLVKSSLEVCIA